MAVEIERKFLVHHTQWSDLDKPSGVYLKQSYLLTDPEKTIRVRILGDQGFITIKGKVVNLSRSEFEYEIPLDDARQLIGQFGEKLIEKTRFYISLGAHTWEVDEFSGANEGLIVAEIELSTADEQITLPDWVAEEVSDDPRYYNSSLQEKPFCEWVK